MLPSQQNKYLETSIQSATPAQLLIMLYDGAIRFCRMGIDSTKKGNIEDAHKYYCKTQDIVQEFIITLDRKADVAEGLLQLYEYFNFRLVEANTKKDIAPAEEVLKHLQELKEIWIQAAKSVQTAVAGVKHG
jgi:flagellar secretion chaperone FliS